MIGMDDAAYVRDRFPDVGCRALARCHTDATLGARDTSGAFRPAVRPTHVLPPRLPSDVASAVGRRGARGRRLPRSKRLARRSVALGRRRRRAVAVRHGASRLGASERAGSSTSWVHPHRRGASLARRRPSASVRARRRARVQVEYGSPGGPPRPRAHGTINRLPLPMAVPRVAEVAGAGFEPSPLGYEPNELPDCSIPRRRVVQTAQAPGCWPRVPSGQEEASCGARTTPRSST